MDIKKRIQELSLDQKAKLYFMGLVRKGIIDRLPDDPKAAYIRDMMDKEDPKMDPEIRSDFDDPTFENLKEFTDYGQEGIYPKKEKPGDMFQQKEVEDMFPNGMASRSDKAFQDRVKQHADWTEQGGYNNTFVHMQYHETKGLEDEYFIYQTQHYNSNYDDFRNPKFTLLSITKNKGTEKEEDLGKYIVDTNAYVKDLETLRNRGVLGKRVMEGDTYEKMAAKGKKAGNLKQGTVRKRLRIKDGEKIPLARITKAISSLKKRKSLNAKDKKYLKALNLAKTLKTTTNVREMAEKLGYFRINENTQKTVKVKDLTFDMIKSIFVNDYKEEPSNRPKSDSDETVPSYKYYDSVSFTNGDGSSTYITDEIILDDWKEKTLRNVGNVDVILDPTADVWFNKVKIEDPKFKEREKNIGKGIASYYASKKSGDFTGD